MLPYNAITLEPRQAAYLSPDTRDTQRTRSLELGGIALNDASQGRQVQTWLARVNDLGTQVLIEPEGGSAPPVAFVTGVDLTAASLAFDSNMQPVVAFVEGGVVKLRWFNTITSTYVTTSYPGARTPKVCTDDKRDSQAGASDVIFAYVRADDMLVWRQQRDRYTVERIVGPAQGYPLRRVGMTVDNRLQFELRDS